MASSLPIRCRSPPSQSQSGDYAPLPVQRPLTFLSGDDRSSSSASFPPQRTHGWMAARRWRRWAALCFLTHWLGMFKNLILSFFNDLILLRSVYIPATCCIRFGDAVPGRPRFSFRDEVPGMRNMPMFRVPGFFQPLLYRPSILQGESHQLRETILLVASSIMFACRYLIQVIDRAPL
jgi:hypothetical protein